MFVAHAAARARSSPRRTRRAARELERRRRHRAAQGRARHDARRLRPGRLRPRHGVGRRHRETVDHTLRRKTAVQRRRHQRRRRFDPAAQWDGFAIDTFDGLGAHTATAPPPTTRPPSPSSARPRAPRRGRRPVTVTFSEAVAAPARRSPCRASHHRSRSPSTGTDDPTLDPTADLPLSVGAVHRHGRVGVSDVDTNDPPDTMAADARDLPRSRSSTAARCQRPPRSPRSRAPATRAALTGTAHHPGRRRRRLRGPVAGLRGFYLQDATGDGDPATSDAIFVFNGSDDLVDARRRRARSPAGR